MFAFIREIWLAQIPESLALLSCVTFFFLGAYFMKLNFKTITVEVPAPVDTSTKGKLDSLVASLTEFGALDAVESVTITADQATELGVADGGTVDGLTVKVEG